MSDFRNDLPRKGSLSITVDADQYNAMLAVGKAIRTVEGELINPPVTVEIRRSKSVELDIAVEMGKMLAAGAGAYFAREFARYLERRIKKLHRERKVRPGEHLVIKYRSELWLEYTRDLESENGETEDRD